MSARAVPIPQKLAQKLQCFDQLQKIYIGIISQTHRQASRLLHHSCGDEVVVHLKALNLDDPVVSDELAPNFQ